MPAIDGTYPTVVSREMMDSSQSIHTVVIVTLLEVIDLKVRVIIGPMVDLTPPVQSKTWIFLKDNSYQ
jgi:hypothetical protein